uniref:Uncharacterized protein n=1 Tax=Polynucleobacter necessarius subsp. necessarius (strain STIR1) TaxID=452638 RepID=B1XTE4_POLNS
MTTGAIPKINLRNPLVECGQSVRKENAGKYQNYAIKDCKVSIAAGKTNRLTSPMLEGLFRRSIGVAFASQIAIGCPSQN